MNTLLLSIIIPTYNCREYIGECLDPVLDEYQDRCEVILSDDGSTDGTGDILDIYSAEHKNIKVIKNPHRGPSHARNVGLDLAEGEYVTFIDCDDALCPGFLGESLPLLESRADLYIFGIVREYLDSSKEIWSLKDRVYETVSHLADDYIRTGKMLIYSNCNKFYRNKIIQTGGLRFAEDRSFGEDRMFNYEYLKSCGRVETSSLVMLRYIQRSELSLSTRHIPGFFHKAMELHRRKAECFVSLSKGTTDQEKALFRAEDLCREVEKAIDRFRDHPEEIEENLPEINRLILPGVPECMEPMDLMLVLGSPNCGYRAKKAYEIGRAKADTFYIVSGGNPHIHTDKTEAGFMAGYLRDMGLPPDRIFADERSVNTRENLEFSARILYDIRQTHPHINRIGIVTVWYHMYRALHTVEEMGVFPDLEVFGFPCHGDNTNPANWYDNPIGRKAVIDELKNIAIIRGERGDI